LNFTKGQMMLNKILVALDLSQTDNSKLDSFPTALSLAQKTGAKLMLLNVINSDDNNYPNPFFSYGYEPDVMDGSSFRAYQEQWAILKQQRLTLLRSLVEKAAKVSVMAEFRQEFGHPGRTICELAQTWSADLIVVGSRGLTVVKQMFLGSVSNYVTHHAPCSVYIVRESKNHDPESSIDNY
jgi:nucleotide-binding universal stress UspA family protein